MYWNVNGQKSKQFQRIDRRINSKRLNVGRLHNIVNYIKSLIVSPLDPWPSLSLVSVKTFEIVCNFVVVDWIIQVGKRLP